MSLDELLKKPDLASRWGLERRKMLRIGLAVLATCGVTAMILAAIFFLGKIRAPASAQSTVASDTEAEDLARLMRMREETERLQREINGMRAAKLRDDSPARVGHGRGGGYAAGGTKGARSSVVSYDPGDGFAAVAPDKSELYIPTGAVFQARLITPIKTSVQRTFVLAETTNEFRMDMKRRIPARSRLVGRSRLDPVLKGVVVEFETLVLPNGIETSLAGLALSRNALPEIEGLYFSNDLQNYGAALAFGFLSGFAGGAREREPTIFGSQPEVSLGNQVLAGLSTASFQVAEDILSDIRNRSIEYVVVPAGERVFVALTRRYDLGPRRPN